MAHVKPLLGWVRNGWMGDEASDFISNTRLADFVNATAGTYIDNCPDTVDSLRKEIQAAQKDLSDDDAMDEAKRMLTVTYSLSTFFGGDPPVEQLWEKVLKAWNFSLDTDQFVFNEDNTRLSMKEALNRDQKGKGRASVDASEGDTQIALEHMVSNAFVFAPHQFVGKSYAVTHVDYLGMVKAHFEANQMGCGKAFIIAGTEHPLVKSIKERSPGTHGIPKDGPWGPCIVICQADLVKTPAKTVHMAFKGLRRYYIVSSAPDSSMPEGVNVIQTTEGFLDFLKWSMSAASIQRPSPAKTQWVSMPPGRANAGDHVDDDTAADDDENSEGGDEDEPVDDEPTCVEQEPGLGGGVVNFTTAVKRVRLEMAKKGAIDDDDTPGFLIGGDSEDPYTYWPGNENDKRPYVEEKLSVTHTLAEFFKSKDITTGRGVLQFHEQYPNQVPVSGRRLTRFGPKWFNEALQKSDEGPTYTLASFNEGHILRNVKTTFNITTRLLPKQALLLASSTPLYGDATDLCSYSSLFAHMSGIDNHLILDYIDIHSLSRDFQRSQDLIDDMLVSKKGDYNKGFVQDLFEWADENLGHRKWWCLLDGYRQLIRSKDDHIKTISCKLFHSSFVNERKISTRLKNHKGRALSHDRSHRTVEVHHEKKFQSMLVSFTDLMLQQLSRRKPKPKNKDHDRGKKRRVWMPSRHEAMLGNVIEEHIRHVLNLGDDDSEPRASSFSFNCILNLIAVDWHNFRLVFDSDVNRKDPLQKISRDTINQLRHLADSKRDPRAAALPERIAKDKSSDARLGAAQVASMAKYDKYGGMVRRHFLLAEKGHVATDDTVHMMTFALSESPIISKVIDMIMEGLNQPDMYGSRVFVVVDSPLTQNNLVGALRFLGLNVINFSADLQASERDDLLEQFNDRKCNVHALIVPWTMKLSGMNMHRACNWGIMVNIDDSAAKTQQIMARLYRIGSEKTVRWFIVIQAASFARVQELFCHTKQVKNLSVTGRLPLEITGDLRAIMCYEVAREQFGAVESKYVAARYYKQLESVEEYEAPWVKRHAVFYSWLAALAFENIKQSADDVDDFANVLDLIDRMIDLEPVFRAICLLIQSGHDADASIDAWLREADWADVDSLRSRMRDDQQQHDLDIKGLEAHYWKILTTKRGEEAPKHLKLAGLSFTAPPVPRAIDPELSFTGFGQRDEEKEQQFSSADRTADADDCCDNDDLYESLGADHTTSFQDVLRPRREIAFKLRPDKAPNDSDEAKRAKEDRIKKVNDAAKVLPNEK
ncbi:hypothetical protein KVR01_010321 [Diaporthe batatas]|uniref:uncharacterized protein n=1 Tax=Diaporthe batatas TaxID=748121 RepID=UPI001D04E0D3|nr:uncharacterized protein KVR01_010321 [Diaporthe batatas]KAG8159684.1 hypothetical protein KVR01_010321 [Diaporthe batatas]